MEHSIKGVAALLLLVTPTCTGKRLFIIHPATSLLLNNMLTLPSIHLSKWQSAAKGWIERPSTSSTVDVDVHGDVVLLVYVNKCHLLRTSVQGENVLRYSCVVWKNDIDMITQHTGPTGVKGQCCYSWICVMLDVSNYSGRMLFHCFMKIIIWNSAYSWETWTNISFLMQSPNRTHHQRHLLVCGFDFCGVS